MYGNMFFFTVDSDDDNCFYEVEGEWEVTPVECKVDDSDPWLSDKISYSVDSIYAVSKNDKSQVCNVTDMLISLGFEQMYSKEIDEAVSYSMSVYEGD